LGKRGSGPKDLADSDDEGESFVLKMQKALAATGSVGLVQSTGGAGPAKSQNNRLYVGNLPPGMIDHQLKAFFSAAAAGAGIAMQPGDSVVSCWIAADGKYGFIEFRSEEETTRGLSLSGLELNNRELVIKRPNDWTGETTAAQKSAGSVHTGGTGMDLFLAIAGLKSAPSPLLLLKNMVTVAELKDDGEYTEILSETKEECEKFGTVVDIKIPRPSKEGGRVKGVGNVYVLFDSKESSSKARGVLHGRVFDGKTVEGEFLDEAEFTKL